jgi:hypothetical protein
MFHVMIMSVCMWLGCSGTYLGPDFIMNIDGNTDQAVITWTDGHTARVQFVSVLEGRGHPLFKGAIISSTDSHNKATLGDIILLHFDANVLGVMRPGNYTRWDAPVCWQGFNLEPGQRLYPSWDATGAVGVCTLG